MRFDASMESLINTGRSESFVDLNETDLALSRSVLTQSREMLISFQGKASNSHIQNSFFLNNDKTFFFCCIFISLIYKKHDA